MNLDSIFRRGIDRVNGRFYRRRVIFSNVIFISVFFASIMAYVVAPSFEVGMLALVSMFVTALFYILHAYYADIITKISVFYYQTIVFLHSSFFEPGQYVEYSVVLLAGFIPIFFRKWWALLVLSTSFLVFHYPMIILDVYESYFELTFVPAVILYLIMIVFIKETETYESKLISKHKELVNLNKEKNSIIGIVAHDLKSPLNNIKGFVNLISLSNQKPDKEIQQYVDHISSAADKMSTMITTILNTELIDDRKMILDLQPIDPSETIHDLVEDFKVQAQQKNISINADKDIGGIKILADSQCLMQVFQNLISNAIKFSPLQSQIDLKIEEVSERVRIKVIDEGPGVTVSDQKKLFQKYQKLSARPTAGEDSTGLGLAIARKFVNAMNGEIWYESQKDKGAIFVVDLAKA